MKETIYSIYVFIAQLGGLLAFILIILAGVKLWNQSEEEEEGE